MAIGDNTFVIVRQYDRDEADRLRAKVDGMKGVNHTPGGISVPRPRRSPPPAGHAAEPRLVQVSGGGGTNGLGWVDAFAASGTSGATVNEHGQSSTSFGRGAFEVNARAVNGMGTNTAYAWLFMRPDSNGAFVASFFAGSIDFMAGGTMVAAFRHTLNLGTNAANVLEFVAQTVNNTPVCTLQWRTSSNRTVVQMNNGNVVFDWVRSH